MANKEPKTPEYKKPDDTYINFFALHTDAEEFNNQDEPDFGFGEYRFSLKYYNYNSELQQYFFDLSTNKASGSDLTSLPGKYWGLTVPRMREGDSVKLIDKVLNDVFEYGNYSNVEEDVETNYTDLYNLDPSDPTLSALKLANKVLQRLKATAESQRRNFKLFLGTWADKVTLPVEQDSALDRAATANTLGENSNPAYLFNADENIASKYVVQDNYLMYKFGLNYGLDSVLIAAAENT